MKFKGTLSCQGLRRLEKEFLPTLEKHGKSCTLLLNPDDAHVIQQSSDTDGMQLTVRWAREVLFEMDSYKCSSKHNNLIAFSFEVALLLRVLRSAGATDSEALEVKLAMRQLPGAAGSAPVSKPYLAFSSSGHDLNMTHDLPVSKPFGPAEIDRLNREKDVAQVCPFYLDVLSEAPRLQAVVDKLKSLSAVATFVTSKQGNIYLEVSGAGVHMATELQGLTVLPAAAAQTANNLTSSTSEDRLHEALDLGDATSVVVHLKHFARTLHSVAMMAPAQVLVGISEDAGYVHFMFVFVDHDQGAGYDDSISFSCKLPVRVEE